MLPVRLELPYQFKNQRPEPTSVSNQPLLQQLAADTELRRFRTYNRKHCGRCVPCMIRKAALIAWDPARDTTEYVHPSLANAGKGLARPDDAMAAALAVLTARQKGLDRFLGASLAFADPAARLAYRNVLANGLNELETLLQRDGLL
jgi:hypothetical protein